MIFFVLDRYVLKIIILSALLLLTSCTLKSESVEIPSIVFQYSYQEPSRKVESANLSKRLSKGKVGELIAIKKSNRGSAKVRLGGHYFSANGNECRRYTVLPSNLKSACKINNRWYQAQPIIIKE